MRRVSNIVTAQQPFSSVKRPPVPSRRQDCLDGHHLPHYTQIGIGPRKTVLLIPIFFQGWLRKRGFPSGVGVEEKNKTPPRRGGAALFRVDRVASRSFKSTSDLEVFICDRMKFRPFHSHSPLLSVCTGHTLGFLITLWTLSGVTF